jgi:hypothetical protein
LMVARDFSTSYNKSECNGCFCFEFIYTTSLFCSCLCVK